MTRQEVTMMMTELKKAFDIVRIVEPPTDKQCCINANCELQEEHGKCFDFWKANVRCQNCVSMRALSQKQVSRKFEFLDSDVYLITAMYVEIDDKPYVIEMLAKLTDDTLLGAWGANEFVDAISHHNRDLYRDALTGAYNRHYYDEQLAALPGEHSVGYVDLDMFKNINDTWGHHAGDEALKAVTNTMISCVRDKDSVVRLGGDEFIIVLRNVSKDVFAARMEKIRQTISTLTFEEFPDMHISVSIGGYHGEGTIEDIVQKADDLLYDAKKERNRIQLNF